MMVTGRQEHKALHFSALWKGPTQAASSTLDHFLSFSDHPYFLPSKLAWCRYHSLKTWPFMGCLFSFFSFFFSCFPIIKVIKGLRGWLHCIPCSSHYSCSRLHFLKCIIIKIVIPGHCRKCAQGLKAWRTEPSWTSAPTVVFWGNASEKHIFS